MNDIRRTILWVIFGFSMVLLWDQWQVYNGNKATFFGGMQRPAATASAPVGAASSVPGGVPSSTVAAAQSPATPPTGAASLPPAVAPAAPRERITVSTDVMRVTFDTEGGSLIRTEFLKHQADDKKETFVLLDESAGRTYVAQSGLIGGDFPTHKAPMTFSGDKVLKDGMNELVLKFASQEQGGIKLVKTYTFRRGAYDVAVKLDVVNSGTAPAAAVTSRSRASAAAIPGAKAGRIPCRRSLKPRAS